MTEGPSIVRKPEVNDMTGLPDSTLYKLEQRGQFPKRFRVTARLVGWLRADVEAWIRERAEARTPAPNTEPFRKGELEKLKEFSRQRPWQPSDGLIADSHEEE